MDSSCAKRQFFLQASGIQFIAAVKRCSFRLPRQPSASKFQWIDISTYCFTGGAGHEPAEPRTARQAYRQMPKALWLALISAVFMRQFFLQAPFGGKVCHRTVSAIF
ncbi:MAG: hypothetical protein PHE55_16380 [Methylococcaceae bacterium]|nr:hypothetical protein [Methylococcaceae bacterium]